MPSRVRAILYNENIAELTEALTESVTGLTARGCNHVILACITSHYFLEGLALSSPQRDCVVDLLKATAESCAGVGKLKILCTEGTAQSRLFDKYFGGKSGLTVYPDEGELTALRAYIEAVKQNRITSGITASFADFAANLPYENIVLGCTELSVLFDNADIGAKRIIDPLKCGITELKERLTR
jgi:aspartate racemase